MSDIEITQVDEIKLNGRIYHAIKACVNNRYRVLAGVVAYYSFIYTSKDFKTIIETREWASIFISFAFALFTIINSYNYIKNTIEQRAIEKGIKRKKVEAIKECHVELFFSVVMIAFIIIAHRVLIP